MRNATEQESREMLKNLLYVSIISADNDELSEDVKQEIITRFKESKDWKYILEPMANSVSKDKLDRYIKILGS